MDGHQNKEGIFQEIARSAELNFPQIFFFFLAEKKFQLARPEAK